MKADGRPQGFLWMSAGQLMDVRRDDVCLDEN